MVSGPATEGAKAIVDQYIGEAQVCLEPILLPEPPQLAMKEYSIDLPTILYDAGGGVNNVNAAAKKAVEAIVAAVQFSFLDLTSAFKTDTLSPDHAVCALTAAHSGDKEPLVNLLEILLTPIAEEAMLEKDEVLPPANDLLIISMQLLSLPWSDKDLEKSHDFVGVFYYVDPTVYGRTYQSYVTKYSTYASVKVCANKNSVRDRFWYYRIHLRKFDVPRDGITCDWSEDSKKWQVPYDTQVQGLTDSENKFEIEGGWSAGEWVGSYLLQ